MKIIKKIIVFILTMMLSMGTFAIPVFASSLSQDGLEVTLTTDKEKYKKTDQITATLKVTNENDYTINNVSLENVIPEGYILVDGVENIKRIETLDAGETVTLAVTYIPSKQKTNTEKPGIGDGSDNNNSSSTSNTGENTTKPGASSNNSNSSNSASGSVSNKSNTVIKTGDSSQIMVWIILLILTGAGIFIFIKKVKKSGKPLLSLFLCVVISIPLGGSSFNKVDAEEISTNPINIETTINIEDKEITLKAIINYNKFSSGTNNISLKNFTADTYDIYINTKKTVTFMVEVESNKVISSKNLAVYDDDNNFISYMNDDGIDGDKIAGDSIYTAQVKLSSKKVKVSKYLASIGKLRSNSFEICYYRDLTRDEFIGFMDLQGIISALSFDNACKYIKTSDKIKQYSINIENKTINYQSTYGIYGIWEENLNSSNKGNGENAIPIEKGLDYDGVDQVISSALIDTSIHNKNIVVVRPFRNSEFVYDDYKKTGELLNKGIRGNLTILDDEEVTLSKMKTLNKYGIVLVDSHGLLDNISDTPYIVVGEELDKQKFLYDLNYYFQHVESSADYLSGRIYCTGHKDRLAIGKKFFDKYYSANTLSGSYWYLGTCYSMYNDSIANTLIAKGASAVEGFTQTVSIGYCNNTLFETVLNGLLLSADTIIDSIQCAKNIYGDVDPTNHSCTVKLKGNENFKLINSISTKIGKISGKVCKASDRNTPIKGALISVYKNNSLIRKIVSDDLGNYSLSLPIGEYRIETIASGYIRFDAYTTISENDNAYMETFLMVIGSENEDGTAKGYVYNAMTGNGIEGVTLNFRKGWNNTGKGDIIASSLTDSNGAYSVNMPLGNYTMSTMKNGYITSAVNIIVQKGTTDMQNGTMTPIISGNNYRIVLTWGDNPSDLDSHIEGTLSNGKLFHVYYGHKSQYDNEKEVCNLDVDDTTSYGPETITLDGVTNYPYYYYIHRYSGYGTLALSAAQVKVYQGENLLTTFNVPSDQGNGDYWNVFAIVDGKLLIKNTITVEKNINYIE